MGCTTPVTARCIMRASRDLPISDIPADLNIREQIAPIDNLREEALNFAAEQHKLSQQAAKLRRDRWLAPSLVIVSAAGGVPSGAARGRRVLIAHGTNEFYPASSARSPSRNRPIARAIRSDCAKQIRRYPSPGSPNAIPGATATPWLPPASSPDSGCRSAHPPRRTHRTPRPAPRSARRSARPAPPRPASCRARNGCGTPPPRRYRPRAARPACWMNGATPECSTSTSSLTGSRAPSGTTSQPSRQPVITQVFEKLLQTITRSSGSATSSRDGAAAPPS